MPPLFFDYELPAHLIAQHPTATRDESRLLVVRRSTGELEHRVFRDLPQLLAPGDLVVLNDTKVIPARVIGRRANTGGKWEGLFLQEANSTWELLAQARGYPDVGEAFILEPNGLKLILTGRTDDRHWLMQPDCPGSAAELLAVHGHIPLPPYIRKGRSDDADKLRYQTVYAANTGSVAAPTAGLHFTPEVFAQFQARGIRTARVTLHVGLGTFAPVKGDDPTQHTIHAEWCDVSQVTVDAIHATKAQGGRVIAIGTTTSRTLESAARDGELKPFHGDTNLFIHPPYRFRVLDGLVTNFHLPKTTLLLLVQAFSGSELLRKAYDEAVRHEYRFFSYGDAMVVL